MFSVLIRMGGLIENVRQMIAMAFMGLPLMLIAFFFFVGFGLGNVGMIILFLGQITVVPAAVALSNTLLGFLPLGPYTKVISRDICNLVPSAKQAGFLSVAPSYWMAEVLFFVSYLITNAAFLYNEVPQDKAVESKVRHRKEQALTAIILTTLVTLILVALRFLVTECETALGIALAGAVAIPLGVGWYYFASLCGARNADVFGIAAKMLPAGATEPPPMMCVYKA